ncbi:MAG: carboxypeptidase regulatory-like domain-containing protein [candidate division WS1 bacterium]|jgi:hypothetical protein|nr:carboxypeptidase regulatory-like domain-containing protein [candidate division WS1 bacterium]
MRYGTIMMVIALAAGAALLLTGCGGGGGGSADGPGGTDTASLTGTVYAPAVQVAGVGPAQDGPAGIPVPNCPVEVRTEPGGQRLASGTTDGNGRYAFYGLEVGQRVMVEARINGQIPFMAQARLRDGTCEADVTEGTTMAAICARISRGDGTGADADGVSDAVLQECLQYQARNGYRYGQSESRRPDFTDPEDVQQSAGALMTAAAEEALARARSSRSESDCTGATQMMLAQLRARGQNRLEWDTQLMNRLTEALQRGPVTEEQVAHVLSRVMNRNVTAEQVRQAVAEMRQQLGFGQVDRDPEVVEVVAAMTMNAGAGQQLRLQTLAQVQAMVQMLAE